MRPEKHPGTGRKLADQCVALPSDGLTVGEEVLGQQAVDPTMIVGPASTKHFRDPGRGQTPRDFPARGVKHISMDVLRLLQVLQVFAGGMLASDAIGVDRAHQDAHPHVFRVRVSRRAHGNRHQNRQHQEQGLGRPE